jgi:GAF domain-containing protein
MHLEPDRPAPESASAARTLSTLAEQSVRCAASCCGAAATLTDGAGGDGGHPGEYPDADRRTATTHPDLAALVSVQLERDEGPVPAALERGEPVAAPDLLADERWPRYRALALDSGIRSSLTLPFRRGGTEVTLSLYSFRPGTLHAAARGPVAILGEQATDSLVRDRRYHEALSEVDQLSAALRSRPVIDRASGIVMYLKGCDADEAFTLLRDASQRSNRKLTEVARAVVHTRGGSLR